jgi:hypothetical protein
MIESGIDYNIYPDRIRNCPQIPNGISASEWLRKVPEFTCDCQAPQWV